MHDPAHVSPRRLAALRALAERGATEGEREAARTALAAALRDQQPTATDPAPRARTRRPRGQPAAACRWIKRGSVWVITGPEDALRSGRVTVQARDRRPREVVVTNVRHVDELWIADEVPEPRSPPRRPPPPSEPLSRPGHVRAGQRPSPPYRRPDLQPEHFMQGWRLEDMLEELAGADVLHAARAAMEARQLDEPQRRAYLTAEIWRHQKLPDADAPPAGKRRPRA